MPHCRAPPIIPGQKDRLNFGTRQDRTLIWNQAHLRRILRAYEIHHNQHRPHRSLDAAAPLKPLPEPFNLDRYRVRRQTTPLASSTNTAWSHNVDEVFGTHRPANHHRASLLAIAWSATQSSIRAAHDPVLVPLLRMGRVALNFLL